MRSETPRVPLRQLAALFLRLGTTAFGGPAAHIALMEHEVVGRRAWLTRAEFLDLVAAANLLPGPSSTEVAIFVGWTRGGPAGLVIAGACFILPAMLITGALAWGYVRFGALPATAGLLAGVRPVVIAIVAHALVGFARAALRRATLVLLALAALAAAALGAPPLAVLAACGLAVAALRGRARGADASAALAALPAAGAASGAVGLWPLFGVFLKVGAVLFGSGYVLLAFLRADLVQRLGWLSERQLLDAVAVGQVTPGPVFTTATFVGYLLRGVPGALVATLGIFLPAFVLVAASGPVLPRLQRSPTARGFLDGVIAGSLALMALVCLQLARGALVSPWTIALALVSFAVLLRWRGASTWLVLGGAALGLARGWLPG